MARHPKQSSMVSRYCSREGTYWPALVEFRTCPECGGETYGVVGIQPISREEAERRVKQAEFDRWYLGTWERERTGPTPEEKGAEEARIVIDLDRRLEAM